MDTRQVLLADAFAEEPLGGTPVAVLPDGPDLDHTQSERIADELGAAGVVTATEGGLTVAGAGADRVVEAAVAGGSVLFERGALDAGTHAVEYDGGQRSVEVMDDGQIGVPVPGREPGDVGVTVDTVAGALGIDPASLRDVGADLPMARAGDAVVVPVNFFQHLGNATLDVDTLRSLLDGTETDRVVAITFDTLRPEAHLHTRVFTRDGESATSGAGLAACGRLLGTHDVFDDDIDEIRVESGYFLDRPARAVVTLESDPQVRGRALTVLDGEVAIPPGDDDEIIEV